jgi:hypothetical protein
MRVLIHVSFPCATFNAALRDGSAAKKLGPILEETKPESAYFATTDRNRGGYMVYDIKQASEIPGLCEPWFLNFDAKLEIQPVMVPDDLRTAGLDGIVKRWG